MDSINELVNMHNCERSGAIQAWLGALDYFVTSLLAMTYMPYSPISFSHSSSVSTATPCFLASASFDPAPGPATT
jgi:hypothetical protein